ncbi:MAG TPA: hypothetical protein VJK04_03540 [Candidatus Paceibacterota bacterium]
MIFVLIGSDSYRRRRRARAILEAYAEKHSRNTIEMFDLLSAEATVRFFEFGRTPGLFDSLRFAVLENLGEVEKVGELKKYLKNIERKSDVMVMVSENTISKDFTFLKQKPNKVEYFDVLSRAEFVEFLKKEAKKKGANLDANAISFMADIFRGDSLGAVNELQKLSFLKNARISLDFLRREEGLRAPHDFFSLLRGLWGTSLPAKLKNLELLLSLNEDPAKIFNVLAYLDAQNIGQFADYDVLVKSGKIDYEEALLEYVIENSANSLVGASYRT